MQIEVRVRAKIKNTEEAQKKLEELGAVFEGEFSSISAYFGKEIFKKGEEVRILEETDSRAKKKTDFLTYKGQADKKGGRVEFREILGPIKRNSKTFEKLNIPQLDALSKEDVKASLESAGYKKFVEVNVTSEKRYEYKDFNIKFFKISEISHEFIEIQKLAFWEKDLMPAKKEIYELMAKLGVSKTDEIKKGGVEMVYEKS